MEDLRERLAAARKGDSDAWEAVVRCYQDMAVAYAFAILGDWQGSGRRGARGIHHRLLRPDQAAAPRGISRLAAAHRAFKSLPAACAETSRRWCRWNTPATSPQPKPRQTRCPRHYPKPSDALPEDQRAALLLHYMNDFRQREIADFLQIPLGTVKSRLYHARKTLKQRMKTLNQLQAKRPSRDQAFTAKVMRLFDATKLGDIDDVRQLLSEDSALANAEGVVRTSLWASDAKALHVAVDAWAQRHRGSAAGAWRGYPRPRRKVRLQRLDSRHRPG